MTEERARTPEVEILSLVVRCSCGEVTAFPWRTVADAVWTENSHCSCCGDSVRVLADVRCDGCGRTVEVRLHGGAGE